MEDMVVAKTWQSSLVAAVCVAGIGVEFAQASPAGMTSKRPQPAPIAATAVPSPQVARSAATPTAASPSLRQRIANSMPEVRVPWGKKDATHAPPAMPMSQQRNDAISLSTPTGPATPELVIAIAQMSEQRGEIAQARQHYQQALRQWPGQPDVLRAAARMEDRLGQLTIAESLYQQAVASKPDDAGALNDLGLCLARQGKLDQSAQVLEQAIHLQPEKALYRNNAATVLVEMRQDQRAIGHLAAVHGPADAQFNMGSLLVQRNRATEAESYFEAALDINPDMKEARTALAQLGGQKGQPSATPVATTPVPSQQAPAVAANTPPATPAMTAMPGQTQPQTGPQLGPQMNYPTEARTPDYGRSTYLQPQNQQPHQQPQYPTAAASSAQVNPQPSVPWVGQATPRALPPVGGQQSGIRR
jgi:tetratricopeptide (TPR) repeat protein